MKDKIYNPASTNQQAPADGMAAVNTFNSEETDDKAEAGVPRNFERSEKTEQKDDTRPIQNDPPQ